QSTLRESPVSRVLLSSGLVPAHEHQWLFSHGGGSGIRCALGKGHEIWRTTTSPEVARLVASVNRYGDRHAKDQIVSLIFNPDTAHTVRTMALSAPANGFTQASDYAAWLATESVMLKERLAQADRTR